MGVRHELGSENTREWDKRWVRSQAKTEDKCTGRSKDSSTAFRKLGPGSVQEVPSSAVGRPVPPPCNKVALTTKGSRSHPLLPVGILYAVDLGN